MRLGNKREIVEKSNIRNIEVIFKAKVVFGFLFFRLCLFNRAW